MPVIEARLSDKKDQKLFEKCIDENRSHLLHVGGDDLVVDASIRNVYYLKDGRPGSYVRVRAGGEHMTDKVVCRIGDAFTADFDVEVEFPSDGKTRFIPKGSKEEFVSKLPG